MMINSLNSNAISHFSGINNLPIYVFIFCLLIVISTSIIPTFKFEYSSKLNILIFVIIILSFLFIPFWTSYKNIIICVGPLASYFVLIHLNREEIKNITWIFLIINLPLAVYEYFTISYIYNVVGNTYGNEFEIIAYSDLMRSKGLFASCLGLGYFAMFASFIYKDNIKIISVSLILCLLGGSRQPLALVLIVFILYFVSHFSMKNFILTAIIGTFIITFAIYFVQQNSIDRILMTADFQNDTSNGARIFFWLLGINTYFFEYSLTQQVFGDMGYFQEKIGYNAESAWLTLLLDVGLIITSIYVLMHVYLMRKLFIFKEYKKLILVSLIFISMWTVPLIYNFNQNMYFWIFILTVLDKSPSISFSPVSKISVKHSLTASTFH